MPIRTQGSMTGPHPRKARPAPPAVTGRVLLSHLLRENEALLREVAELRVLRRLAYEDALTGLGNRRYFDERLAREIGRSLDRANRVGSLVLLHFASAEPLPDPEAVLLPERTIRMVARLLRRSVSRRDVCCRLGGDEFGVVLPGAGLARTREWVEALRAVIAGVDDRLGAVVASFGQATWPQDGVEPATIIDRADRVLCADRRAQRRARRAPVLRLVP